MQVHFRHPDRIKENWNARYIELLSWYSDVERTGEKPVGLLAKVGVEGSNPFARSSFLPENQRFEAKANRSWLGDKGLPRSLCLHIVSNFPEGRA